MSSSNTRAKAPAPVANAPAPAHRFLATLVATKHLALLRRTRAGDIYQLDPQGSPAPERNTDEHAREPLAETLAGTLPTPANGAKRPTCAATEHSASPPRTPERNAHPADLKDPSAPDRNAPEHAREPQSETPASTLTSTREEKTEETQDHQEQHPPLSPHRGEVEVEVRIGQRLPPRTKQIYTVEYRRMLVNLREARGEAGLTQYEVAAHFARPQSFVSKCESGERRIDPTELRMFAKLYGKPVSHFLDEQD